MNEKISVLLNNEEFAAKLASTDTAEMKALFAAYGVEMTDEEVLEFVQTAVEADNGQIPLNEDDLENVTGGSLVSMALKALGWTWKFAVKTYGSEEEAAKGIISYWKKKILGR